MPVPALEPSLDAARPDRPLDREAALDALATQSVDVLVVGGGITGVGIALDAVTRGFSVGLVERDDLASGTSSKSSKLVHGGVRYLAQYDFGLVREAARERDRLRRLAPHLTRPLGFVIPVGDRKAEAELRAGLLIYGLLAFWGNVERFQGLTPQQVAAAAPLAGGYGRGGLRYYDARTDDARLTLQVARTAREHGALVANHAEVVAVRRTGGRAVGVTVRDRLGGGEVDVDARWVVSATGVWADRVRALAGDPSVRLTPSKGVHLTFSRADLPVDEAVIVSSHAGDGRMVFAVPWDEQVYVGTTDEHHEGALDQPGITPRDAGYLLHAVNEGFGLRLRATDAVGAWAGLRPLLAPQAGAPLPQRSADLSRRHAVSTELPGLLTITGGKLTTFRAMAEDLVDRIAVAEGNTSPCVTTRLRLGVQGDAEAGQARVVGLAGLFDVDPSLAGSLFDRHGDRAAAVLAFAAEHGEGDRLLPDLPYLTAEVRWAVRHELARTVDDVLQRRLRVSLRRRDAGGPAIAHTAAVLREELGLSADEVDHQVDTYLGRVRRERGVVGLDAVRDPRVGEGSPWKGERRPPE